MARRIAWIVLVLVVLAVAAVAADVLLRAHAESVVERDLRSQITGLHGTDVTIAGTPFTTQLLAGSFERVDVTATSLLVDGLELDDVQAVLTDVDTEAGTAGTLDLTAVLHPQALTATSGGDLTYEIVDGELVATLTTAPLAASMVPTARGDAIELDVTRLMLADVAVAPEDLPLGLGDAFEDLMVPIELHPGLSLDEVRVDGDHLVVTISGTDVAMEE